MLKQLAAEQGETRKAKDLHTNASADVSRLTIENESVKETNQSLIRGTTSQLDFFKKQHNNLAKVLFKDLMDATAKVAKLTNRNKTLRDKKEAFAILADAEITYYMGQLTILEAEHAQLVAEHAERTNPSYVTAYHLGERTAMGMIISRIVTEHTQTITNLEEALDALFAESTNAFEEVENSLNLRDNEVSIGISIGICVCSRQ